MATKGILTLFFLFFLMSGKQEHSLDTYFRESRKSLLTSISQIIGKQRVIPRVKTLVKRSIDK